MQVVRTPCKTELIAINKLIVIQCLTQIRLALIPTTFKRPVFRYSLSEFCLHSQVDRSDTQKYANWFALRWLVPHGAARVSHSAFYICILDVRKKKNIFTFQNRYYANWCLYTNTLCCCNCLSVDGPETREMR